jgi:hypothetical protein
VQLTEKRRNRALAGSASAKSPPRFSCPPAVPHVAGLPWTGGSGAQFQLSLVFYLLHSPQRHKLQTTCLLSMDSSPIFLLRLRLRVKACLKYPILNLGRQGTLSAALTFLELDKTC